MMISPYYRVVLCGCKNHLKLPFESPTERSSRCELNLYGVKLGFGIKAFVSRHREILVS